LNLNSTVLMSRVLVTQWHCAAPRQNGWREWDDIDGPLRLWSECGSMSGGRAIETGNDLFSNVAARAAKHFHLDNIDPARLAICAVSSKPDFLAFQKGVWHMCDAPLNWWRGASGARGPGYAPVAACASGAHAVALGARLIDDGYADAVLCSAWEAPHSDFILAGYRNAGALSKSGVMRPFDAQRDGFVPSAGLATLLLEDSEKALRRGATPLALLASSSMRGDATAMTAMNPSGESVARAIEAACGQAQPSSINAHATATKLNDVMETRAIKSVFGRAVPVSATKPLTGHWLGAAGALEAILAVQSVRENWLPPTVGLETPDAACDLDYILKAGREADVQSVLSLSYGFGGHIGALLFEKFAG
jgi:3-oxoacyl-(acyl-carrier-protein) synthase